MSLLALAADDPVWPRKGGFRLFLPGRSSEDMAFLDAVTAMDAPGAELWSGYDARQGTRFFSIDGPRSGMRADWISSVWQDRFGIGAHVVRTLWHELVRDNTEDRTYIALGLCAQRAQRTATEVSPSRVRCPLRSARDTLLLRKPPTFFVKLEIISCIQTALEQRQDLVDLEPPL